MNNSYRPVQITESESKIPFYMDLKQLKVVGGKKDGGVKRVPVPFIGMIELANGLVWFISYLTAKER